MAEPDCYCSALRRATRRLSADYDAALSGTGINIAQFSLLRSIERRGTVSLSALGRALDLDRSTVGRNLRVLERRALVRPAPRKDGREAGFELTETGRATLEAARGPWRRAQQEVEARLGSESVAALLAKLAAV